jgi:hypothetical protein
LIDVEVWHRVRMFLAQHAQNLGHIDNVRSEFWVATRMMYMWSHFCGGNNITATETSEA